MRKTRFSLGYYLSVLLLIFSLQWLFFSGTADRELSYREFRSRLAKGEVERVVLTQERIHGAFRSKKRESGDAKALAPSPKATPWRLDFWRPSQEERARQFVVVRLEDKDLLHDMQQQGVDYRGVIENTWFVDFLQNWLLPLVLLFFLWGFVMRRMGKGPGVLSVGKNKAKIYAVDSKHKVTFDDVAGVDEAKAELQEIVGFLSEPGKYTRLGAKLPRGVLLVGPPGTGKTLLARAVAGEAGVPFFSLSGSDFVEMFVGVGAARVRDLFQEAKSKAPCIIFIDELDAIGKSRAQSVAVGGHDERESTLNQLLVEMDGFDPSVAVVLMAATNRPDVLDRALLRPGRFDRQVLVDRPDRVGREQILQVHTRRIHLAAEVDLGRIAEQTPGFSGADLANLCNEAALLASRRTTDQVEERDFQEAIEKVVAGLERRSRLINPRERRIVAYHESGHAIVGYLTPGADPVRKVSIVPRGLSALGYTMQAPTEDRFLMSKSELLGRIRGLLGGRAAEEIVFGEISTGAANDLERVGKIAQDMVTLYGMSERLPNLTRPQSAAAGFLGEAGAAKRSEYVEGIIDQEVFEIVQRSYEETKSLLRTHRVHLDRMAEALLAKEVLDADDIRAILQESGVPVLPLAPLTST